MDFLKTLTKAYQSHERNLSFFKKNPNPHIYLFFPSLKTPIYFLPSPITPFVTFLISYLVNVSSQCTDNIKGFNLASNKFGVAKITDISRNLYIYFILKIKSYLYCQWSYIWENYRSLDFVPLTLNLFKIKDGFFLSHVFAFTNNTCKVSFYFRKYNYCSLICTNKMLICYRLPLKDLFFLCMCLQI